MVNSLSNNLSSSIRNREIRHGNLDSAIDKSIQVHISRDKFFSYQINLGSQACKIVRNRNFIAMRQLNRVALYDLVSRKKIWDCPLSIRDTHSLDRLIVSKNGVVLAITGRRNEFAEKICHIFFEGRQTGSIDLDPKRIYIVSLKEINGRLFALPITGHTEIIFEWDMFGSSHGEIPTGKFSESCCRICLSDANFYVLIAGTNNPDMPSRVFIYDLMTKQSRTVELEESRDEIEILSASIHKNSLICGISYIKNINEYPFKLFMDPKIIVMNLVTGKVEAEYILEQKFGKPTKIVANNEYICFQVHKNGNADDVWIIDRRDRTQRNIFSIPHCIHDTSVHFLLSGQLLHICHANGSWRVDGSIRIHCVLDIEKRKVIKQVSYILLPWQHMSFQDGKLVIIDSYNENRCVYVEDYEQVSGFNALDKVESDRWKRRNILQKPLQP